MIIKKKRQWQESAWLLGICLNGFDGLKAGHIRWISNGKYEKKKWFADPFILDYDKKTVHLLVEEFDYQVHRGRIAKLTIDRSIWTIVDCKILLDLPTHLSFPMIWRENGMVYICPENNASEGWNMYHYDSKTEKLELVKRLSNEKLTDATLYHDGNTYWLFSTYEPRPNGAELTIWKSASLFGGYQETQRVSFNENVGRNAGMVFPYRNKLIRPAQESNRSYGHSIAFQEMSVVNGKFSFKEVYRFNSTHPQYNAGTHTFNLLDEMAVIDVKGLRYPVMGKIIMFLSKMAVALHIKKPFIPR